MEKVVELKNHMCNQLISDSAINVALVLGLAFSAYLSVYRWLQRHRKGPKSWPLLGSSLEQLLNFERLHDWIQGYFEKADTVTVPMPFGFSYTYTTNPDNVEYILKSNFANYPKGGTFHDNMEELLGDGIFNTDGETWRQQRKTASYEFASKVLRDFSTIVFRDHAQKLACILAEAARRKFPMDMQDLFMRLTLDSICKIGFGVDMGNLSPLLPEVPFAAAFDKANYIVTLRFVDPFWKLKRLLNIGSEALLKKSLHVVDDFTYHVIRTRRAEMESSKAAAGKQDNAKQDILSRFLLLSEHPENNLNDKSLRDVILNFIIAGRDTTATTLSWFIYMLTQHQNVADKIYEELCNFETQVWNYKLDEKHAKRNAGENLEDRIAEFAQLLNYDSLTELTYLHAAITETLRLYPAVPLDTKGVLENDVLPDGSKVKKGTMVTYSPYCMGRSTSIWGGDALQFKPERWLKDGALLSVSPFRFTPFQAGPRICLGKDSAYLQMKMTTAIVCRFFKFNLVEGHPVKYKMMSILSMAHGLQVNISIRA